MPPSYTLMSKLVNQSKSLAAITSEELLTSYTDTSCPLWFSNILIEEMQRRIK